VIPPKANKKPVGVPTDKIALSINSASLHSRNGVLKIFSLVPTWVVDQTIPCFGDIPFQSDVFDQSIGFTDVYRASIFKLSLL
jgi:hypothetical protein